jgi:hypothetical protein
MTKPHAATTHVWEHLRGASGRNDVMGSDRADTIQTYGPGTISMLGGDDHYQGCADEVDGGDGYDVCYAAPDSLFTSCETNPDIPPMAR